MADLLSSRVVTREARSAPRGIDAVATNITAFVGPAEWGPTNVVTRIRSWDEYLRVFGGFIAEGELAQSVYGFFLEGGVECDVVRVVHVTDVTDPATKTSTAATLDLLTAASGPTAATLTGSAVEPFELTPGATLTIDVDGGGPAVATFDAAAATRTSGATEPFALSNNDDLIIVIDGGTPQSVVFLTAEFVAIGAATAQEVADVINAKAVGLSATDVAGAVVITSDTKGTDSSVEITGGLANAVLTFPGGAAVGTGDVGDISAVTAAEIETVVEADIPGLDVIPLIGGQVRIDSLTTGGGSSLQVAASSVQVALGLTTATVTGTTGAAVPTLTIDARYDGARGNSLQVQVAAAKNGDADRFDLSIVEDGVVASSEIYPNLSLDPTDARYVETVLNDDVFGSSLVVVTDLAPAVPNALPALGTFGPMTGGDDGLAGLVDADFLGGKSLANGSTGLRALDTSDAAMLVVPRPTAAIHNGIIEYVTVTREESLFAFLDLPPALDPDGVKTYMTATAGLTGLTTFAAAFWPRLLVDNPDTGFFGTDALVEIPNAGVVAARHSRTDLSRPGGVYEYSGGPNQFGTLNSAIRGLANDITRDRDARDILVEVQVNPISPTIASGAISTLYLDGTRTLKEDADFRRIAQRRGVILIRESIERGLDPFRHQANTPVLRTTVERVVSQFLQNQLTVGAFASNVPNEAYIVDFSDALNTPDVIASNLLLGKVALAMKEAVDWIVVEFSPLGAA